MTSQPTLERRVGEWLRAEAPERAPDRILATTLDRVAVVGQERTIVQWRHRDRSGTSRALLIAATVALLLAVGASALLVGARLRTQDGPLPPPPGPAVRILGEGPTLAWTRLDLIRPPLDPAAHPPTRVAWIGDRFVLVDQETRTVATSVDGMEWAVVGPDDQDQEFLRVLAFDDPIASWEGDVVSWSPATPESGVRIRRHPDAAFVADFAGTVDAVGIGPAGIVVSSHTQFDQLEFVEDVLGPTWSPGQVVSWGLREGVLSLTSGDGRTASITLSDHGVDPAQFENRGQGKHSVDGREWATIPDFPGQVSWVVGTAEGFVALGDSGTGPRMFHSPDGFAWERLAVATGGFAEQVISTALLPWRDGALETDGTFIFQSWTAAGRHVLPMAADVRSREHPQFDAAGIGAGPFGIISVDVHADEILFSSDGIEWSIQAMPDQMAQAGRRPGVVHSTNVAVGTDAVVVLMWEGTAGTDLRPSLWLGRLAP